MALIIIIASSVSLKGIILCIHYKLYNMEAIYNYIHEYNIIGQNTCTIYIRTRVTMEASIIDRGYNMMSLSMRRRINHMILHDGLVSALVVLRMITVDYLRKSSESPKVRTDV